MRAATLVRTLQEAGDWVLVLPPWPRLYHWRSPNEHSFIPWERFFDLESLNEYVPSIEFHDYLQQNDHVIDEVGHVNGTTVHPLVLTGASIKFCLSLLPLLSPSLSISPSQ